MIGHWILGHPIFRQTEGAGIFAARRLGRLPWSRSCQWLQQPEGLWMRLFSHKSSGVQNSIPGITPKTGVGNCGHLEQNKKRILHFRMPLLDSTSCWGDSLWTRTSQFLKLASNLFTSRKEQLFASKSARYVIGWLGPQIWTIPT